MIKVMISDNNFEQNIMLSNFLTKEENIKIIAMTSNDADTLNSYISIKPDVLILNSDYSNKYNILNELDKIKSEKYKRNVILVSNHQNNIPKNISKVYSIYKNPYNLNLILNSIHQICSNNTKIKPNYKKKCEDLFLQLGFNLLSLGTQLLIKTIVYIMNTKNSYTAIYKIYQELSVQEKIPPKQIQWNIENSINSMYRYTTKKQIKKVFSEYDGRKPTAKYLIGLTLHKFNSEL